MQGQEIAALSLVALAVMALGWRWWRRAHGKGPACGHCCGGRDSAARPMNVHLRASKDGPVSVQLKPPAA
ncbi:hypothetical protein NXS98_01925 [Fontisphaera persica]|uniref:hypothetical protein n=1 Tax=Fontisphaera persica TaxID=2974023 RepID=UPI0024BF36C3|nr:hypothetical protein [Fontisphaera persica]WCJ59904.1 hypothetical protein NXS98_01925 [Fontisphaera persica]